MVIAMRTPKTFTVEPEIDAYVSATKGEHSASERVNELLKRAILLEQSEKLEREAAAFFAAGERRTETKALQKAALRTLARD